MQFVNCRNFNRNQDETAWSVKNLLVALIVLVTANCNLFCQFAEAQEKQKDYDFGAETVEGDEIVPLPVDQVEEQDKGMPVEELPVPSSKSETKNQKFRVSKILADGPSAYGATVAPHISSSNGTAADGIVLTEMTSDSVFLEFGLKNGDIIRTIGGIEARKSDDIQKLFEEVLAKETVVLEVGRNGQEIVVPVTVDDSPFGGDLENSNGSNSEATTLLNVNDVEISTLVKTFSKLTKRNYIVDTNVKGKITIHLPSAVSISEALRILDAVLLLKGFTTVPVEKNTWKVVNAKDARQTTIPLLKGDKEVPSDVMVTQLIRLKHIAAADVQQLLSQFISKDGVMNAFAGTNSLVVIDSAANLQRLGELIREVDVPALDQEITIIPILHAEAKDISDKLKDILGGEEKDETNQVAAQARRSQLINNSLRNNAGGEGGAVTAGAATVERRALPFKIIPDERTNAVIVVADPELTLKVRALVEQLDTKLDQSSGRFWVYRLEHADAEELADILNSLISGSGSSSSRSSSGTQGSSISRSRTGSSRDRTESTRSQQLAQRNQALQRQIAATPGTTVAEGKVNLEGEVSIAHDPATNSLIINASKTDYDRIKEVVRELDIKRRQVLVEATILEVTLSKDEGMGIELQGTLGLDKGGVFSQTNFGGITNLLTNPAALTDLTLAAASTGTLTLPGDITIPSQAVLVSAVSRLSNVNVLSTPTIVSTDNEEAEIIVGENVPFVSSTSTDTSNINNTFNSIERQDVGITLRITPQISSGDFVVLKIFVEISNVVPGTRNDPNGPTTTIRTTDTTVTVKDQQMIVTGGLISDSVTDSTRGVPFLQDIPFVGNYFKRQDEIDRRTNLLVFITPKVIKDQFDARETTRAKAKRLENTLEILDMEPKRKDVLQSESLDRVSESTVTSPQNGPSMITPPGNNSAGSREDQAKQRTAERLGKILETQSGKRSQSVQTQIQNGDVVEFSVRPELPGIKSPAKNESASEGPTGKSPEKSSDKNPEILGDQSLNSTSIQGDSPRARLEIENPDDADKLEVFGDKSVGSAPPETIKSTLPQSFIVLRALGKTNSLKKIFVADKQNTLGLVVLGGLQSSAAQFFQVGGTYHYREGKYRDGQDKPGADSVAFVCLGRYGSRQEAQLVHPTLSDLTSWNELSAEAVVNLGQNNWTKG